jgi:hypothetical protein
MTVGLGSMREDGNPGTNNMPYMESYDTDEKKMHNTGSKMMKEYEKKEKYIKDVMDAMQDKDSQEKHKRFMKHILGFCYDMNMRLEDVKKGK